MSGSLRLLRQVLDQPSRAHADHRAIVFTDDRVPAEAVALADELHQAADVLDEVADRVVCAHEASGQITWHTSPEPERSRRWVNAVFLQGAEADEVLEPIDVEGVQAGIAHLAQWDFGDETTGAAFVNGEVYDQLPAGQWDRSFDADGYVLTYGIMPVLKPSMPASSGSGLRGGFWRVKQTPSRLSLSTLTTSTMLPASANIVAFSRPTSMRHSIGPRGHKKMQ